MDTFSNSIIQSLISKKSAELRGFGTFFVKEMSEKKNARNPKNRGADLCTKKK